MISEVILPVMDQSGGELTLAKWLKREGDVVRAGDVLCEVETSKASVDIPAAVDGVLRRIFVPEGTAVASLTVIAVIADAAEPLPAIDPFYRVKASAPARSLSPDRETFIPAAGDKPASRGQVIASPRARKLAAEHGIDLFTLAGTGPGGRVVEEDVRRAMEQKP